MQWDKKHKSFRFHFLKKLGELGLMGVLVPTEYMAAQALAMKSM